MQFDNMNFFVRELEKRIFTPHFAHSVATTRRFIVRLIVTENLYDKDLFYKGKSFIDWALIVAIIGRTMVLCYLCLKE